MDDWFTVEQIDPHTFAISEYRHWEETHCYLLCGHRRAVLIDTGLGVANIRAVVDELTDLPVMATTTHAHWDHIGGHKHFDTIAVHELEKDWLSVRFPLSLQAVKENLTSAPAISQQASISTAMRSSRARPKGLCTTATGWI